MSADGGDGTERDRLATNMPYFALGAVVLMIGFAVVLLIFAKPDQNEVTLVVGLVGTTIPACLAAAFSERAARDIRNGTVAKKAKEGALAALDQSGVTEVAQTALSTTPLTMEALAQQTAALSALLSTNTDATQLNTNEQQNKREGQA